MSLQELLREAACEADGQNHVVLREAIAELRRIDPKEIRRDLLRETSSAPTCDYMQARKKKRKAERSLANRGSTYRELDGRSCWNHPAPRHEYEARVVKYEQRMSKHEPCERCMACRVNLLGRPGFFKHELPRLVARRAASQEEAVALLSEVLGHTVEPIRPPEPTVVSINGTPPISVGPGMADSLRALWGAEVIRLVPTNK